MKHPDIYSIATAPLAGSGTPAACDEGNPPFLDTESRPWQMNLCGKVPPWLMMTVIVPLAISVSLPLLLLLILSLYSWVFVIWDGFGQPSYVGSIFAVCPMFIICKLCKTARTGIGKTMMHARAASCLCLLLCLLSVAVCFHGSGFSLASSSGIVLPAVMNLAGATALITYDYERNTTFPVQKRTYSVGWLGWLALLATALLPLLEILATIPTTK
mgnify:CR=1 FL=1